MIRAKGIEFCSTPTYFICLPAWWPGPYSGSTRYCCCWLLSFLNQFCWAWHITGWCACGRWEEWPLSSSATSRVSVADGRLSKRVIFFLRLSREWIHGVCAKILSSWTSHSRPMDGCHLPCSVVSTGVIGTPYNAIREVVILILWQAVAKWNWELISEWWPSRPVGYGARLRTIIHPPSRWCWTSLSAQTGTGTLLSVLLVVTASIFKKYKSEPGRSRAGAFGRNQM